MVARSPGYCRTMMGAVEVPVSRLAKEPRYVPARNQIVSPGCTALGWARAVAKSHGVPALPLPLAEPLGAT